MASIFDSVPNDNSESFNPTWRDLEPLDDTNTTSQEFQPPPINYHDIKLERDVLKRRINRAVNRVSTAILKNQKNFRRLEKELILIRRDVELARSINYKLYKMVSEQQMAELDQVDDDLLSTVLDVEDAVEDYVDKLKAGRVAVKRSSCCDTSVRLDTNLIDRNSRSSNSMCCLHRESFRGVEQSISKSPLDFGAFPDAHSIGIVDSEIDTSEASLSSDIIYRINCLHSDITNIKTSSFDRPNSPTFDSRQKGLHPTNKKTTSHPLHSADVCQPNFLVQEGPYCSRFCSKSSIFSQNSISSQSNDELSRMSFDSESFDRVCSV